MSMSDFFTPAPFLRPSLNLGCLFDIPTGVYYKGQHGEHILNGGLASFTGVGGIANSYKSTLAHFMILTAMDRYRQSEAMIYDTELTFNMERLRTFARTTQTLKDVDLYNSGRFLLTDKTRASGTAWFAQYKNYLKERANAKKPQFLTSPFVDMQGQLLKVYNPFLTEVDSLSAMNIDVVDAMYDGNDLGDSELNTEAMKTAAAKSQMILQLPGLLGQAGAYLVMTAHIGDEMQMNPKAPPKKKLDFLKGNNKFKRVPENFTFYPNNCWYCHNVSVLMDKDGIPDYPRNTESKADLEKIRKISKDTDLVSIQVVNLRGKSGPSGLPFRIIASQQEGIQVGLTEFQYLKDRDRYGIGGNLQNYHLQLAPDISLSRSRIRGKIEESRKLRRALEITSELCQMRYVWQNLAPDFLVTPEVLFEDLKKQGYDWDMILEKTRGYWMFEEDAASCDLHYLSTYDLLNMRRGNYRPYWLEQA